MRSDYDLYSQDITGLTRQVFQPQPSKQKWLSAISLLLSHHHTHYEEISRLHFISRFEKRSRNFNYYRYFTADRVVYKSEDITVAILKSFAEVNQTLYKDVDEIYLAVEVLKESIQHFRLELLNIDHVKIAKIVILCNDDTCNNKKEKNPPKKLK